MAYQRIKSDLLLLLKYKEIQVKSYNMQCDSVPIVITLEQIYGHYSKLNKLLLANEVYMQESANERSEYDEETLQKIGQCIIINDYDDEINIPDLLKKDDYETFKIFANILTDGYRIRRVEKGCGFPKLSYSYGGFMICSVCQTDISNMHVFSVQHIYPGHIPYSPLVKYCGSNECKIRAQATIFHFIHRGNFLPLPFSVPIMRYSQTTEQNIQDELLGIAINDGSIGYLVENGDVSEKIIGDVQVWLPDNLKSYFDLFWKGTLDYTFEEIEKELRKIDNEIDQPLDVSFTMCQEKYDEILDVLQQNGKLMTHNEHESLMKSIG